MKKSLLLGAMALMAAAPAFAETDGCTYETINGLQCSNLWIDAVYHNPAGWNALPWIVDGQQGKARTACLGKYDGKDAILVGYSRTWIADEGGDGNDYAHIVILDFYTGEVIKTQQITCDGQPIKGLLCANQVGCDAFGHVWLMGYSATLYSADTGKATANIYNVDLTDGTATIAAALEVDDECADMIGGGGTRVDYWDITGDITRENAPCTVMAPIASGSSTWVLAWTAEQGSDEFVGGMDGYMAREMEETYPSGVADWGTAPLARIVVDEEYTNNLFYVDGFTTCPALYNNSGAMIDGFGAAKDLAPADGTNGVGEFALAGHNFVVYSLNQYVSPQYCQVNICELGDGMQFEGMEKYWTIPATKGLGDVSDGGTRYHAVQARNYTDENGKEAAYVLTYKCANGIGVYMVYEEGYEDDGVADIISDNNAAVEYFNLQGVRVANPEAGQLVIKRQGNEVTKMLVK